MLTVILLVLGFVFFVLAAIPRVPVPWINLVAAGLACWILTDLIGAWPG